MNHNKFHFRQIPDKTNDVIFLKMPEAMFLGHFWPFFNIFARWGIFFKKSTLPNATIYGPVTPCYVSEKTNEPIPRNLTDRRKDGRKDGWTERWTDGQTLFYRTLPAEAEGPKTEKSKKDIKQIKTIFPKDMGTNKIKNEMDETKKWEKT